jgi:protein TonB
MKLSILFLLLFFKLSILCGQGSVKDTSVSNSGKYTLVESIPEFPGGNDKFAKFISDNLKYPEAARLIGVNGTVVVWFTIAKNGLVKDIEVSTSIGAGCEEEAIRVISMSPKWKPAIQNNAPVAVRFSIPVEFSIPMDSVVIRELRNAKCGFLFEIKGTIYTIDQAESILGKAFSANKVETALLYADKPKYPILGKTEVYLIKIK